ncbi:MAG: sodium:proton antiporter [Rhodospirillaceae bacterium]|nr:MAG: sodium:proton antiporter [Rhodospirillaceae bacterium]
MELFDVFSISLVVIAIFGAINYHLLKLPSTIGLLVISLVTSLAVMAIDSIAPSLGLGNVVREAIGGIDFYETLMTVFLSFLLFAGAMHVDLEQLLKRKAAIALMASLGVMISTLVAGYGFHLITGEAILTAMVFGALISPTDPVAVMGLLKTVKVPKSLEAKIGGESLFNDGIGIVVFATLVAIAYPESGSHLETTVSGISLFLLHEAGGGAVLGLVTGWLAYKALKSIDDYVLEVIITLALVAGTYSLASALHTSGPIAVVMAGLLIGNHGVRFGMSKKTREHVHSFWHLLDEVLNALLFTFIGFEVLVMDIQTEYLIAGALTIPIVLMGRAMAVAVPLRLILFKQTFTKGAIPVMTWGGLRGGISVALALSLPDSPDKDMIVVATYVAVVFSVLVQGLSVKWVIQKFVKT